MRIAVIYFSGGQRQRLVDVSKGLSKGLETQGHQVDLIDGDRDVNTKLTIYGYIALGVSSPTVFGGKIPENANKFLANAGIIAGKRCFAYTLKYGLRASKTLSKLMGIMEHEGMFLKYSEILTSSLEAEAIGKRLHTQ